MCAGIDIAPEVEPWLSNLHRVIGWVGGLRLLGPIYGLRVAVASLIGGEIGAHFGGQIGQSLGGNGAAWRVRFSVELAAANRRC